MHIIVRWWTIDKGLSRNNNRLFVIIVHIIQVIYTYIYYDHDLSFNEIQ